MTSFKVISQTLLSGIFIGDTAIILKHQYPETAIETLLNKFEQDSNWPINDVKINEKNL